MPFLIVLALLGIAGFFVFGGNMPIVPTSQVQKIAKAIATAEGFYKQGSLPQRTNNPGDLEMGDIGYGVVNSKTVYPSAGQGWNALYKQVERFLGILPSTIYNGSMTIQEVANEYVAGQQSSTTDSSAWAQNVADFLGVDTDTPIGQVS